MKLSQAILWASLAFPTAACAIGEIPFAHGGPSPPPPPPPGGQITSVTIKNDSGSSVSGKQITFAQPFQSGDIISSKKIEVRKIDGVTVVPTQEDGCSLWAQDGSRKNCNVSFVEPDTITAGASTTYLVFAPIGTPNTTPNVTTGNITANTNFCLKSSDLATAQGVAETGTWDLICLNNVLTNYSQYNGSTGYGANPIGGWDIYATGPNRLGVHAFQYGKRESDNAIHKWIRTDMWVDFWGSGSTPCPCSISTTTAEPNTLGPLSGGSVGPSAMEAYNFSATLLNGATSLQVYGGASDTRVTTLATSAFHLSGSIISLAAGNWLGQGGGVIPVKITSSGTMPAGITSGAVYWFILNQGNATDGQLWRYQCDATNNCNGGGGVQILFTTQGTGTMTMTPIVFTNPWGGWQGLNTHADRIWVDAAGALTNAPNQSILVGHDFTYLTQKSKAVPPYLTNQTLLAVTGSSPLYYPGSYGGWPFDLNTAGDGPGDNRIGYMDHAGVYALMSPFDRLAVENSRNIAAQFSRQHMYHVDETVGLPVVLNNGPAKNGVTYTTLGTVYPSNRTWPFISAPWANPSSNFADKDAIYERYATLMEPSHMPSPWQAPLIMSGEPEWLFALTQQTQAIYAQACVGSATIGMVTYYRSMAIAGNCMQVRGEAWGHRVLSQTSFFTPSTSPISQYLKDLNSDDLGYLDDWSNNTATTQEKALGYNPNSTVFGSTGFQFWQDDFVWLSYGMDAWRGEVASAGHWATTQGFKMGVARYDAASSVGGGGCLWAGDTRVVWPYASYFPSAAAYNSGTGQVTLTLPGTPSPVIAVGDNITIAWFINVNINGGPVATDSGTSGTTVKYTTAAGLPGSSPSGGAIQHIKFPTALATTWFDLYYNSNAAQNNTGGWNAPPYTTCPSSGLQPDPSGGTTPGYPVGLATDMASSAAMGAILGIAHASTLYTQIRAIQYAYSPALSFTSFLFNSSTQSYPEWAMGPLGATN